MLLTVDTPFLYFKAKTRSNLITRRVNYLTSLKISYKPTPTVDTQLVWRIFINFYQIFFNQYQPYFKVHSLFKPFFLFNLKGTTVCINYLKLYKRWVVTYNLILNLFVKQINPLVFTTKVFRKEATAFNWSNYIWDYTFFKTTAPYFFLQDTVYGNTTNTTFSLLAEHHHLLSVVTNSTYHEKNLKFLKKFNAYTIGLVPVNSSPWLLSYPILIGTNELVTEYYFLTLLSFLKQYSQLLQFDSYLNLWRLV